MYIYIYIYDIIKKEPPELFDKKRMFIKISLNSQEHNRAKSLF